RAVPPPPDTLLVPYTTLFRSFHPHWDVNDTQVLAADAKTIAVDTFNNVYVGTNGWGLFVKNAEQDVADWIPLQAEQQGKDEYYRSEEHTSELQSREKLVCRLL